MAIVFSYYEYIIVKNTEWKKQIMSNKHYNENGFDLAESLQGQILVDHCWLSTTALECVLGSEIAGC